MLESLHAETL